MLQSNDLVHIHILTITNLFSFYILAYNFYLLPSDLSAFFFVFQIMSAIATAASKAPSPGTATILSTSPSSSIPEPSHAVKSWSVIRPHVTFLHKLAAKHFPSLWSSSQQEQDQVDRSNQLTTSISKLMIEKNQSKQDNMEALALLNQRISSTRQVANQAEENENEEEEEKARLLLKDLKKEKKQLQLTIETAAGTGKGESDSNTTEALPSSPSEEVTPRIRAMSNVVERLIDFCNREDRKTKKTIFRVIRCHNCSQSSTGGSKTGIKLALPVHHVEWLTKVRMGCSHSSVDKTMRILFEWYIAVIAVDCMMEYTLLPDTEAVRPDMGGFAMGLSNSSENNLHQRGRRKKGEADKALRDQYERNTPVQKGYGNKDAKEFHDTVYAKTPEMEELLFKLGRGC